MYCPERKMSFNNIPLIDLNLAKDARTKPVFLKQLRDAFINVGFLYLKNFDLPSSIFQNLIEESYKFFELPLHKKLEVEMKNSPHFLGYSRLGNEITSLRNDWREQIDLATELSCPGPADPIYFNVVGPNMWPDESSVPGFRKSVEQYIKDFSDFGKYFASLVAESIGLSPNVFDEYFPSDVQLKMKLVLYPDSSELESKKGDTVPAIPSDTAVSQQGCGPHRDAGFLTYVYQATEHDSLEIYTFDGKWIKAPNIPGTLVVNVGQTLEQLTGGLLTATIHRVLVPKPGEGTRLSIPFFQGIDIRTRKTQVKIDEELMKLKEKRDGNIKQEEIGFQFIPDNVYPCGYYTFKNRIKSHVDVSRRWYPEILDKILQEIN